MIRTVVMASGRGSNFRAVVGAVNESKISKVNILGLVTDRPDTGAESFAREQGIAVRVVDFSAHADKKDFHEALFEAVNAFDPELILTLGYMRIIDSRLVQKFSNRMINIHPALLPAFPGLKAQKQAVDYGVKISGATVHFVDEGVDSGPVILQEAVPVPPDATPQSLSALILKVEHRIVVEAVRLYSEERLEISGRKVKIR